MYEINVYQKQRRIPWRDTYILLTPGKSVQVDDEEVVEHLRKFHDPQNGNGISIKEIQKPKSVKAMNLQELREFAAEKGVDFDDSDSRQELMKKLRGEK